MFRRKTKAHRGDPPPSTFARAMERKWADNLDTGRYYHNEHYFSIVKRPHANPMQRAVRFASNLVNKREGLEAAAKTLQMDSAVVAQNLGDYQPKVLGLKTRKDGVIIDEVASFMYAAVNAGFKIDVAASMVPLKRVTPSCWTFIGTDALHIELPNKQNRFATILSANNFESGTRSNLMRHLCSIDGECIISQSARILNKLRFMKSLTSEYRRLEVNDAIAEDRMGELERLISLLDTEKIRVIERAMRVICIADTMEELDRTTRSAVQRLGDAGVVVEAMRGREAMHEYFASLPGNHDMSNELPKATTENVRGLFSFANEYRRNPGTDGPTLFSMPHTNGDAHDFCPWVHGVPHMFFLGPNGSGKTTLLAKILCALTALNARIFLLDKDEGLKSCILALGGSYRTIKPGSPLPNPLGLEDTPQNRDFLVTLFELMGAPGRSPSATESTATNDAITMVYRKAMKDRRFSDVVLALEGKPGAEDMALNVKRFMPGERYGWMFAETPEEITFDDIQGFDTTYLLDRPEVSKIGLKFLFHHLELVTDGRLIAVPVDEGWQALDNEDMEDKAKSEGASARKQNKIFLFSTQSPDHVKNSKARGSIIDNFFTKFYFPHREVSTAELLEVFDVPRWIARLVKSIPTARRQVVMSQDGHFSVHSINMSRQMEDVAVISSRKVYLPILSQCIEEFGPDPDFWVPHFQQRVMEL